MSEPAASPDPSAEPAGVHADEASTFVQRLRALIETARVADLAAIENLDALGATIDGVEKALRPAIVEGERMQASLVPIERTAGSPRPGMEFDDPAAFFPYSPVVGRLNPLAPPATVRVIDGGVEGEVTFATAYNGPPNSVHGGMIALVLDEILGNTCLAAGVGGFTGTLSIRYQKNVPINTPVTLHGWVDRIDGRKTFAIGEIRLGDDVLARAEGIFISAVMPSEGGPT